MSTENWLLESDLCRCCHTEGRFKNLAEPYLDSALDETYADMLKFCFDINMVPVPGMLCAVTYTICEGCITRLIDALKFKKQVALSEEKFKDMYNRNIIQFKTIQQDLDVTVKEELPDSSHEDDFPLAEENHFDEVPPYEYDQEENKTDPEVKVKKKPKKVKLKSKSTKTKTTTKKGRPKKMKEEPIAEEGERRKEQLQPKFRLNDGDYTVDGATFSCSRCDKKYDKIFSLRFHVKTKHYKIPRFVCPYCKKEFMTPAPLTVHKLEEHNVDERFKCNACKGTFNTKVQLRKHINNFHMLGEKYRCEFCEYESFSFESMYKHKFKHKTSKDHQCRFCRKAFVRKTTLDLHERIHTGDRRKVCNICGQAFVQKSSLNYHMTKYHPEVNF